MDQAGTINGLVFGENIGVLPGAHVIFLDENGEANLDIQPVVTGLDGGFDLQANVGNNIEISFIGFEPLQVAVTEDLFGDVQEFHLTESTEALGEAVIEAEKSKFWEDWRFWTALFLLMAVAGVIIYRYRAR